MLSCSAMGVIWRYTRVCGDAEAMRDVTDSHQTAMVYHTSQRVNGYVENVLSPQRIL